MRLWVIAALAALAAAGPAGFAAARQAAADELLNEPSANWNVYGPGQTHKGRRDKAVQGGGVMQVVIPARPANAWDIGASSPIAKPIRKGDTLMLAFWARLASGGTDGKTRLGAAIQRSTAPYDPIVSGEVELTGELKLVHIQGVAAADFPAGAANVALSLGTAAHTVELGPVFVLVVK
ncbi:MAG: hypothetical protein V4574_04785 [Pseudomonadota bacterium]